MKKTILTISILFLISLNCLSQITFTRSEVETIVRHNLERRECLELQNMYIDMMDSLEKKSNFQTVQLSLKEIQISEFSFQVNQLLLADSLNRSENDFLQSENKKSQKKIHRRNIAIPIISGVSVFIGILIDQRLIK